MTESLELGTLASAADHEESEERAVMEKKLIYKLDKRMCIFVIIYILNYVRWS